MIRSIASASLLIVLCACAGPTELQRRVATVSPTLAEEPPEPDDETALRGSLTEEPEITLALPTTGHLQLGDHTARAWRLFGFAPRLMTPWDVSLANLRAGPFDLELVVRYADLEPVPGPSVSQHPLQHRSLVIGWRPDPRGLTDDDAPTPPSP